MVGAATLGVMQITRLPWSVPAGLLALAAGGHFFRPASGRWAGNALLAVPGSCLLVLGGDLPAPAWIRVLAGVAIPLAAALTADLDTRWQNEGFGPLFFAVSIAGVYATVPDTERALVLVGAALPLTLLAWPWPVVRLGNAGTYAAVGLLAWTVAVEGVGRHSSIIGGIACLGLLVVEPVVYRFSGPDSRRDDVHLLRDRLPMRFLWVGGAVGTHLALVFVASRVVGLRRSTAEAAVLAAVEVAVAVTLGTALLKRLPRRGASA